MSQKSGPGWVRGTGRRDCPVGYPVKGNEPSNVYYEPGDPGYPQVIPEMCFEDAATAVRVGFTHVEGAAAPAAPAGFIRQTGGGRECPSGYPIKGNEPSNIYYRPEDPGYAQVIPEVCFENVSEAEKAGFTRVKVEATKRTEPVAAPRKEEAAAAAAGAAAGVAAAKAADKPAEPAKAAEPARVAAPPPPPPPPPPPAPVAESSGGGWMKWLLPLLALAALAAGIWYFTRDDDDNDETPTPAPTAAATTAAGVAGSVEAGETAVTGAVGSVEALGTENPAAAGSVEAAVTEVTGSVEAGVAAAQGSVEAAVPGVTGSVEAVQTSAAGTVEAGVAAVEGSVEAGVAAVEGSVAAGVANAAGTVEAVATSAVGTVEAAVAGASPTTGASPVAGGSPTAGAIELDAKDIAFDPTEITIKAADEPVTIKMVNTGAAPHNFSIDSLKIDVDVAPGETVDVVIPAGTAPGTYDFYCNVPGHKEAGMVGTLTVE